MIKKVTSLKDLRKPKTWKASDHPYPIEVQEDGTMYSRLPDGSLRRLDKKPSKKARKL